MPRQSSTLDRGRNSHSPPSGDDENIVARAPEEQTSEPVTDTHSDEEQVSNEVGDGQFQEENQKEESSKDAEEDKSRDDVSDESNSKKRKRNETSESSSSPPKKKFVIPQSIFHHLHPDEEERATAKPNQRDDSRFTVTIKTKDGEVKTYRYNKKRRAVFDWSDKEQVKHLNKWRHQPFYRADLRRNDGTVRWTSREAEILSRIVYRAMKTVKIRRNLNWTKITKKLNSWMKGEEKKVGMEYAVSKRSAKRKPPTSDTNSEQPSAADNNGSPQSKGKSKKSRKADKGAKGTGNTSTEGSATKTNKKGSKAAKSPKDDKKSSGRKPQTNVVTTAGQPFPQRKTSAVKRQATNFEGILGNLQGVYEFFEETYAEGEETDDDDEEFSCGGESSDEESESSDEDPNFEEESDDEQDGQRPAGNALEDTLVAAV